MSVLNKDKLNVNYMENIDKDKPIIPRLYTLTHSDITGELYLDIGIKFAYNKITALRDEVLGEWTKIGNRYVLKVDLHIDPPIDGQDPSVRDMIFRRELKLALEAIVYGDNEFFYKNKELLDSPIIVYFNSKIEKFNKIECYGVIKDYMDRKSKEDDENSICKEYSDNKDNIIITLLLPYIERAMYYEKKVKEKYYKDNIKIIKIEEINDDSKVKNYNVKVRLFRDYNKESQHEITFLIKTSRIEIKKVERL